MSWEAAAAIAEIIAAIGVIVSLVYLAGQVRSSADQTRQSAIQSVVNKMNTIYDHQAANHDHASLWARGSRGLDELRDEAERIQFSAFLCSIFKPYEEIFHYYQRNVVEEWTWNSFSPVCEALMSTPGFAEWWELRGDWFSPEFRTYVDGRLARAPGYRRFASDGLAAEEHATSGRDRPATTA